MPTGQSVGVYLQQSGVPAGVQSLLAMQAQNYKYDFKRNEIANQDAKAPELHPVMKYNTSPLLPPSRQIERGPVVGDS